MRSFEFDSFEEAYPELLKALLTEGEIVAPRGQITREITPVGITIKNPRKRVISHPLRKLNYGFMIAEAIWVMSGTNLLESISHYNKNWDNFSDDGITLNGAYGDRIFNYQSSILIPDENGNKILTPITTNQFETAFQQLKADPDTRQATIVLFNPAMDYVSTKDKPCTNLMRFMIRNGKLNMTVFMRSNDIWLGFPTDVFNFTIIQELMAGRLGVEVGKYTHIADSFHIYEQHFQVAQDIIDNSHPSLYTNDLVNAKLSDDIYEKEIGRVFNIEVLTRRIADIVELSKVETLLNSIQSDYWRSLAAVISIYNIRKAKRSQGDVDYLKPLVINEFKTIVQDWKTLKK